MKTSVYIAGFPAEFRTWNLLNTKMKEGICDDPSWGVPSMRIMNKDATLGRDRNYSYLSNSLQTRYHEINFFVKNVVELA
jgi:hypothetical protein